LSPGKRRAFTHDAKNFFRENKMNKAARVMTFGVGGKRRSWKREAVWIAGTAGVGTLIGALVRGKRGAAIGGPTGAAARYLAAICTR